MEVVDAAGQHERYSRVQFEYRYRVDPELKSLESRNSWWFRDSETGFEEWLESAIRDHVWLIFRGKTPMGFDILQAQYELKQIAGGGSIARIEGNI